MTCKIVTIVGARPQFIKAAAVSREILKHPGRLVEVMVHTGQHYDPNMSQVFFDELEIPAPKYNLEVSGGTHGVMTGRMLEGIEQILLKEKPDWVLIYGDTNSTLAGALAAAKLHIPVAHVEAGLRSFNMRMPEEVNRILSDRVSTLLLCPTALAIHNLANEGLTHGVHNVGDVMYDVALFYRERAKAQSQVMAQLGLEAGAFALATCHRAENTDDPLRLGEIMAGLADISVQMPVVLPLHPRTRNLLKTHGLEHHLDSIKVVDPLPFLDMVALEQAANVILTDSGGVQKEAYFYGVPCITLRDETEWVETVELGFNQLVGASRSAINAAMSNRSIPKGHADVYGDGTAAVRIVAILEQTRP
ncbi:MULTISPECIES: non-hydrolyzing UDP-N-acetylglucosamine 2-epimerase [Pseudomonas]|uniref:non-hydrolyzing UDP-N-acetylglucosamine 2-epimerase n=1 Tax=Pseudomonas TaxID=286 RepID=UPI000308D8E3|nr:MULTISPECIES: UDP-N-acetylglucosamine 2-epimerase (non-hydrolyzing) [Pseudomonas]PJH86463.1 UDP-N-acetylglucosamine 2-epimerase (non-hydrolyzing) [Pseudomonas sp. WCS365]ROM89513.1 UDP-N-acetylglucosamine 2-epimerase [Pseudomonas brassicacearum]RON00670.1 UDP-N-acetylglucosamine 2-epimerase [Pseudomonas brassicacearum]UII14496.1 UDP-2,3-diacetamido-2,3-dideoxy-D-glucuronate 2-epimerase [Pseudomonas brassicacearum]